MKPSHVKLAWRVIVAALVVMAALAGVYVWLNSRSGADGRRENGSGSAAPAFGDDRLGNRGPRQVFRVARADGSTVSYDLFRMLNKDGQPVAWEIQASGPGHEAPIVLLVTLDAQADTILGLEVLEQKETHDIGDRILAAEFRRQFEGKKTDERLVVRKGPAEADNEIQAVTGATVSSRSVAEIVNQAVSDLRDLLKDQAR